MDLQKARVILKKINALTDSLSLNGGNIAQIERDLMLSYIRQLYEVYLTELGAAMPKPAKIKKSKKKKKKAEIEVLERPEKQVPEPEVEVRRAIKPEPPVVEPKAPPAPKVEKHAPEPMVQKTPPKEVAMSRDMKSLFDFKAAKELSEKLSEKPVSDLTKELAINDRLLYANDLFGENHQELTKALSALNAMNSLDDAKPHLVQLANQYDWLDKEKREVARSFIKLVRRRYK